MDTKIIPTAKQGFSQVILLGIIAVLVLAGTGGFLVLQKKEVPSVEKMVPPQSLQQPEGASSEEVISPIELTPSQTQSLQQLESKKQSESEKQPESKKQPGAEKQPEVKPKSTSPIPASSFALGTICSGQDECTAYCHNHRGHCESYCEGNNKNELCKVLFPLESIPSCGNRKEWFTTPLISFEYLGVVVPLGSLNPPGHVFPTDHIYMNMKSSDEAPSMPERLDVVSPGEVYMTRISSSEHFFANSSFIDYDLEFYPCKEIYAKFGHVSFLSQKLQNHFDQASGECIYNREGGDYCNKNVNFKLAAGEEIGKTEFKGVGRGVDFWLADYRNDKLNYANPLRWSERSFYITCPADYFIPNIRNTLYSFFKIDGIPRTIEPICGTIEQDVAGTAQGAWFAKGVGNTNSEDSNLALAYDNFNPLKGVFSVSTAMSKSGLLTGAYLFDSQSSGLINRNFKEVTADGKIYCYDSLHKKYEDKLPMILIVQMTNFTNLRIEKQNKGECGNGPWSFSSTYTEFER